jgi:GNAT superfamily N-acetyltransferase
MTDVRIEQVALPHPDAETLIAELNAELTAQYPEPGATHFRLDAHEVGPGRGVFLIARVGGELAGCGAIRLLDDDDEAAEIKRMYTRPARRGNGVARAVLTALEKKASELGAAQVVLETGERQTEALALYERAGYARIAAFGEYVDSPLSVCMGKSIA